MRSWRSRSWSGAGLSATQAGIALSAATITWTAGAWTQARGASRWPTHRFVQAGFAVTAMGLAGFMLALDQDVSWLIAVPDIRPGRVRDGPRLLAARPDRAARGPGAPPGRGHERPVAARFARDGPRDRRHRGARGRERPVDGRTGGRARGGLRDRGRGRPRRARADEAAPPATLGGAGAATADVTAASAGIPARPSRGCRHPRPGTAARRLRHVPEPSSATPRCRGVPCLR